jgi:hypothetical protein
MTARAERAYQPTNTGVVFTYDHYRALGLRLAEHNRLERLLLGKPAHVVRREWARWDALLFGRAP